MSGPVNFVSLNAANATGPGGSFQYQLPRSIHTMQVSFTGGSPTVQVAFEGTVDGTNWKQFGLFDTGAGGVSGDIVTISEQPLMAIRANLLTLTGGSSPTVTAQLSSDSYN